MIDFLDMQKALKILNIFRFSIIRRKITKLHNYQSDNLMTETHI